MYVCYIFLYTYMTSDKWSWPGYTRPFWLIFQIMKSDFTATSPPPMIYSASNLQKVRITSISFSLKNIYIYIHMCVRVYIQYTFLYIYIYSHMYIYIHEHTYIYTYYCKHNLQVHVHFYILYTFASAIYACGATAAPIGCHPTYASWESRVFTGNLGHPRAPNTEKP